MTFFLLPLLCLVQTPPNPLKKIKKKYDATQEHTKKIDSIVLQSLNGAADGSG